MKAYCNVDISIYTFNVSNLLYCYKFLIDLDYKLSVFILTCWPCTFFYYKLKSLEIQIWCL